MVTESGTTASETGLKKASDNRRSNKPIMEKRRRARINNCLNQLKTLILDAMKKDPARHSKLEKADILEMTVKHLQSMRTAAGGGGVGAPEAASPLAGKFRAGFTECASEVGRYPGLEAPVKRRLLQHLANCLNQQAIVSAAPAPTAAPSIGDADKSDAIQQQNHYPNGANVILTPHGMPLVPTRLANGDLALVLPHNPAANVPLLVPMMPTRTSSTASAASTSSAASSQYASAGSTPEPMDVTAYSSPVQKPLALVMRKAIDDEAGEEEEDDDDGEEDDEKPWRPW